MTADDTIHFDHVATHPSEVYAPAHLLNNPIPTWAKVAIGAGIVLFLVAGVAGFRDRTRVAAVVFCTCLASLAIGFVGASRAGHHVGPLPAKSRDWGLATSTPGDEDYLYVSQADALASARQASDFQDADPSLARTITYRWGEWPDRFNGAPEGTKDREMFIKDAGWSNADIAVISRWATRQYGISSKGTSGVGDGTDFIATTNPSEALTEAKGPITGPGTRAIDDAEDYRCVVEIKDVRTNDLGQLLSVTPVRLVCTGSPVSGPVDPKEFFYPKRLAAASKGS